MGAAQGLQLRPDLTMRSQGQGAQGAPDARKLRAFAAPSRLASRHPSLTLVSEETLIL